MVNRDEGFEDDHPVGVLRPLNEQVRHLRDRHIRLIGTVN